MSASGQDSCLSCGGHGWKFCILRRSLTNAGGVAERGLLRRARVVCLMCAGSGRVSAE
jgi:hypothetical protein